MHREKYQNKKNTKVRKTKKGKLYISAVLIALLKSGSSLISFFSINQQEGID